VRITYLLSFEDYFDAAQARNRKGRKAYQAILLVTAALLFGAWIRTGSTQRGHVCALLALLLLGCLPLTNWIRKRSFGSAYRRGAANAVPKEFTVEISEEGLQYDGSAIREEWSKFSKYSESGNAFILYQADSIHAIFPKRAFDITGVSTFRRLVQSKLARL
jgi:hypothetical protein